MTIGTADNALATATESAASMDAERIYRKIKYRLLPFIFFIYILNQLDRINVSFAKLQFMQDLQLSDAAYGLGAGLFFIGYLLFEVPSNIYLHKKGAKATFLRIMFFWGL